MGRALHLPADLLHRRAELLGRGRDRVDVGGGLFRCGGHGGRLRGGLLGGGGHLLGGGLELGGRGRDQADDAADGALEAVGELDHGALPLGGGGRVGQALDLGLLGGLAGDHGLDALDRLADGADLVAAAGLADLRVDLAAGHPLQHADEAAERAGDPEDHDQRRERHRADQPRDGGRGQDHLGGARGLFGAVARLPQLRCQPVHPALDEVSHLGAGDGTFGQQDLCSGFIVVLEAEAVGPVHGGEELLQDTLESLIGVLPLRGVGERDQRLRRVERPLRRGIVAGPVAAHLLLAGLENEIARVDGGLVDVDPDGEDLLQANDLQIDDVPGLTRQIVQVSVRVEDQTSGERRHQQKWQERFHQDFSIAQHHGPRQCLMC